MGTDYSREIFDMYFSSHKILVITLKNNEVLEGMFVSFIHGDPDSDPFIIKWHFVDTSEIDEYHKGLDVSIDGSQDIGRVIKQKDIKSVQLKE